MLMSASASASNMSGGDARMASHSGPPRGRLRDFRDQDDSCRLTDPPRRPLQDGLRDRNRSFGSVNVIWVSTGGDVSHGSFRGSRRRLRVPGRTPRRRHPADQALRHSLLHPRDVNGATGEYRPSRARRSSSLPIHVPPSLPECDRTVERNTPYLRAISTDLHHHARARLRHLSSRGISS